MNYTLRVNRKDIPLHVAKVSPPPYNKTEIMPFAILPMNGPADFEVTSRIPPESVVIRLKNLQIPVTFDAHTIRFRMEKPRKISLEINGSYYGNVAVLACSTEEAYPALTGKEILRYPPGEHTGDLAFTSDNTVVILKKMPV